MNIKVEREVCTKCGICIKYCSFAAIEYSDGIPEFLVNCVLCGACVKVCPVDAIRIDRKVCTRDLSMFRGVLAFVETTDQTVKPVGLEMLSAARKLAVKLNESCAAVALGVKGDDIREILTEYGAEKIYAVESESLAEYNTQIYTDILVGILSKYKPSIVLFGATHQGRDLAPRIAARIETGLTADCTELDIDRDGNLLQIRPTFGGNIMATILTPGHRPQIATVRANVMKREPYKKLPNQQGELERIEVRIDLTHKKLKLLEEVREISPYSNVEEADYIVSGGKGLGKAENFDMLRELVQTLGKAVGQARVGLGASRSAVDAGWIPYQHQVGQTGKAVKPKLYIACGISGQIQHIMGMRESERVIAINTDRNAPIFRIADLGLVGDLTEAVPLLYRYLKENMGALRSRKGGITRMGEELAGSGKIEVKKKNRS